MPPGKLASEVRRRGRYVANELRESSEPGTDLEARRVETACGIGARSSLKTQTGVRRLLTYQQQGLGEIAPILSAWEQPADLIPRVDAMLGRLENRLREQSKEQLEADLAYDALDLEANSARRILARGFRLLNLDSSAVPEASWSALCALEADHPTVFFQPTEEGRDLDDGDLDDEPDE